MVESRWSFASWSILMPLLKIPPRTVHRARPCEAAHGDKSLAQELKSPRISSNSSSAARRSSTISAAITSGSSRMAESSRLSSLSQKMSTEIVANDLERLPPLFALVVDDHNTRLLAEGRIGQHQVEPVARIAAQAVIGL